MKCLNRRGGPARIGVLSVAIVAGLLMVAAVSASSSGPVEPRTVTMGPSSPQADDGGAWEVGLEAAGGDLSAYACSEATYLRNRLTAYGWTNRFLYCGANAWEEDFKGAIGGNEQNFLDTVDLMFYVGHGSPSSFTFDSNHDDNWLTPGDCEWDWGNGDNEWVGLTSCQVLADSNRTAWSRCMNGTHQVLGFITNASARLGTGTQGYNWAYYITNNWTVTGAWFKACDVSQPAGRRVRVLAEEASCFNDRPASSYVGCTDAVDSDYWWWDHTCGSELPRPMDVSQVTEMPVFRTPPLSLAEAQGEYTHLGNVFRLPAAAGQSIHAVDVDPDIWRVEQGGLELEMEANSGLFTYYDMNLWSGQTAQAALSPRTASISADDARTIADTFLTQNGLMPDDAEFYEVTADTLTGGSNATGVASVSQSVNTVYQVIYSRVVTATVANGVNGPAATQEFLVVGPGAKLKVYVPTTPPVRAAGAAQEPLAVVGVQGGWRTVDQTTPGLNAVNAVPIITDAQVRKAYEQVPSFVLLNNPPIDADSSEIISTTLAYWEEGVSSIQSELLPVYALYVEYFQGADSLNEDYAYIPANATYMRPYAKIENGPAAAVEVGEDVVLTAADASKTLAELGFDPILDFTLGSGKPVDPGDPSNYLYEWFVDNISDANKIGGGASPTITYHVRSSQQQKEGKFKQTIILRVTDIGSADLRTSIATFPLEVFAQVVLPYASRK